MPDISFPSSPSVNDTYSFGGKTWIWNGAYWALNTAGSINGIDIGNITPATGAFTTLSATGNITGSNILTSGLISATGNITGNYFIGNGSQLTGLAASYGNANVAAFLADFGSNSLSTTGTVTSANAVADLVSIRGRGDLQLLDSDNSNFVALQAPATVTANLTFSVPGTDGSSGQAVVTDGAGNLSFGNVGISTGKSIAMTIVFG